MKYQFKKILCMIMASYIERRKDLAELCVHGFIRLHCTAYDIPQELQQLCLSMYFIIIDRFSINLSNNNLEFDMNNNTMNKEDATWKTAYGEMRIQKGDIKVWRIKLLKNVNIFLGVISCDEIIKTSIFVFKPQSFGIFARNGRKFSRECECGWLGKEYANGCDPDTENVIAIILDMTCKDNKKNATLSYKINDEECGIAFDSINVNKSYSLALSAGDKIKVQILE